MFLTTRPADVEYARPEAQVHVLQGYAHVEDGLEGVDHAVVELDEATIRDLIAKIELAARLEVEYRGSFACIEFHDSGAEWYGANYEDEDPPQPIEGTEAPEYGVDWTQYTRSEIDRIVVSETSVLWRAYAKHTDVEIETESITLEYLRSLLPVEVPNG